jgi:hypothetical protein
MSRLKPKDEGERTDRAVAAYIQARLKAEDKEHGRGRIAEIAKATGFSSAHLANVKNHGGGGDKFARGMATFWGIDFEELRRLAVEVSTPTPTPPSIRETKVELDPRYPNLTRAIIFCEHRVRRAAIDRVLRVSHRSKDDLTPERWLSLIEAEDIRLEMAERDPAAAERERQDEDHRSRELEDELAPPAARSRQ